MLVYLCLQTPFTVVYLVFAGDEPPSVCMDQGPTGLIVRSWFRGIGYTDCAICGGLFLALCFGTIKAACSQAIFGVLWILMIVVAIIKTFIWAIVSIILYALVIEDQCDGRVYGFGLALVVINSLYLAGGCCEGFRRKQSN